MDYLDVIKFRHACKIFDETKKISKSDFELILEAGRLSPSSTGLEQWDFVVVQNAELKEKIKALAWNQVQISSCSHLVAIVAKISDIKSTSKYVMDMIERRPDKSPEEKAARVEFYKNFITSNFKDDDELLYTWSHAQCMFPALNMMNEAASLGIDSCPIEGIDDREEITKLLGCNPKNQRLALLVPFGYRLNPQPQKLRREMKDVVRWID